MSDEVQPDLQKFRAEARVHTLGGLIAAFDKREAIAGMVRSCETSAEALSRLSAEPFGFSEFQAQHILDTTLRCQTKGYLRALVAERTALTAE